MGLSSDHFNHSRRLYKLCGKAFWKQGRRMLFCTQWRGAGKEFRPSSTPSPGDTGLLMLRKNTVWEWKEGNNAAHKLCQLRLYDGSGGAFKKCVMHLSYHGKRKLIFDFPRTRHWPVFAITCLCLKTVDYSLTFEKPNVGLSVSLVGSTPIVL